MEGRPVRCPPNVSSETSRCVGDPKPCRRALIA
jgi:hypothetical protein